MFVPVPQTYIKKILQNVSIFEGFWAIYVVKKQCNGEKNLIFGTIWKQMAKMC